MKYQLGEFEELVLLTVAAQHDQAYGVSILEFLTEKTNKKMNISAIHVSLKRLETKGFVASRFGGVTDQRGGRRKKYYTITQIGKNALDSSHSLRTGIYQLIPQIKFQ